MNTLKDFINFVKKPTEFFSEKLSFQENLKMFFILLFWQYLFVFCIVAPFLFFVDEYVIPLKTGLDNFGIFESLLLGILVVPFIEEIIFRLPLRYERNYIFQLIDFISGNRVQKVWKKHYVFFFYAFAITFGLLHITNYENTELLFYFIAPFLVLTQFVTGLFIGYLRLKAGFFWGFLFHAFFNGIAFLVGILFYHNVETISYSDTKIEEFSLHELQYIDKDSQSCSIGRDDKGNLVLVTCSNVSLQYIIGRLDIKRKLKGSDCWVDLDIFAPKGISKEKIVEILEKEYEFE